MMLGGVSRMERDVRPDREAWMAFAGPLASFGIAVFAWLMQLLPLPPEVRVAFLALAFANLVLGAFNLLPAFPMDGGRVLRGLLVRRLGPMRATQVAATIGKGMAVLFGLVGLLSFNVLLVLIAAFVYMGASGEQVRLELRHVLEGVPVSDVMSARLGEARVDESTSDVARRLFQQNLAGAIVKDTNGVTSHDDGATDHVLGIVTTNDLARPENARGRSAATIGSTMRTDVPRVHARDDAAKTLDALVNGDTDAVLVLDETEHVVGLVTTADIQRAMTLLGTFGDRR
jgi:CBS domain-containing protein